MTEYEIKRLEDRIRELWNEKEGLLKENAELKKENEELKSIAEFQQSSNMKRHFEIQELYKENAELKEQIEKMKCCGNCRFSESDTLNGTFCHREGCFVVASAKCKLWEM